MKKIILFLLLSASFTSFGQVSMYKSSTVLSDGDSCFFEMSNNLPIRLKEEQLGRKWVDIILNTPVLKALEISKYESIIRNSVNVVGAYNNRACYDCEYFEDIFFGWPSSTKEFNVFLHQAVSTPKLRKVLFPIVSKIACDVCSIYPKDYKNRILRELYGAKAIVADMPNHRHEIAPNADVRSWRAYNYDLYIDGELTSGFDLKGFLYRRILIDGFTIEELSEYISALIDDINGVDVSNNGDYLYSKEFNNTLQLRITADSSYFYAIRQRKTICRLPLWDRWCILKCEGGYGNNVYNISCGYYYENYDTKTEERSQSENWIINNDGEILFEQRSDY